MYFKKILVSFLLLFSLYLIKNQFLPNGNPIGLTNVRAQTANPVRFEGTDLESLEAIEESTLRLQQPTVPVWPHHLPKLWKRSNKS